MVSSIMGGDCFKKQETTVMYHTYGEIIEVTGDTFIVKVTHYGEDDEYLTVCKDAHQLYSWEEDRREHIIRSRIRRIKVGNWVKLIECRDLFYVYEQVPRRVRDRNRRSFAEIVRKGIPYRGKFLEYRIVDVDTREGINLKRWG